MKTESELASPEIGRLCAKLQKLLGLRCLAIVGENDSGSVRALTHQATAIQMMGLGEYLKATGAVLMSEVVEREAEMRRKNREKDA